MVALVSATALAYAAQRGEIVSLHPYRDTGWLRLDLRARNLLDDRTVSTIESGLPGTCVFHLRVENRDGEVVVERLVELSLRFDLWENHYVLDGEGESLTLPSLAAADSAWSTLHGQRLCALDRLAPQDEYRVLVRTAVQPLAPEDRERLSHYVSRNSGGGGEEVALDLGALISGIFGRHGSGERIVEYAGRYFRRDDLEVRP